MSNNPEQILGAISNIFVRLLNFKNKGDIMHGHQHTFDHLSLLSYGSVKVTVDEKETIFEAPHLIYIRADKNHQIEALQDNTILSCIHALKDDGELIDPEMMPQGIELNRLVRQLVVIPE